MRRSGGNTDAADVDDTVLVHILAAHRRLGAERKRKSLSSHTTTPGASQNVPAGAEDNAENSQRAAGETRNDVEVDGDEARGGIAEDGRVVAAVSVAAVAVVATTCASLEVGDRIGDGERGKESQSGDE